MAEKKFMELAISKTLEGIRKKDAPFGVCIVRSGRVVAVAHNTVRSGCDSTAHAEINAIRQACKKLKSIDLSRCTIYSTTEPCPMCFSAIHWARIGTIVFGTRIRDAKKVGFSEIPLSDRRLRREGKLRVKVIGGVMRKENLELLGLWKRKGGKPY
jgi:tRNA(Arg) A34 adenosine deaminase TadA